MLAWMSSPTEPLSTKEGPLTHPRHRSSGPPYIFIVGCLFVLLVTAVQVWRQRGWHQSFESIASLSEDVEIQPHVPASDTETFEAVGSLENRRPRQYGARIEAAEALADGPAAQVAIPAPPVAQRMPVGSARDVELTLDPPSFSVSSESTLPFAVEFEHSGIDLPIATAPPSSMAIPDPTAVEISLDRPSLSPDPLFLSSPVPTVSVAPPMDSQPDDEHASADDGRNAERVAAKPTDASGRRSTAATRILNRRRPTVAKPQTTPIPSTTPTPSHSMAKRKKPEMPLGWPLAESLVGELPTNGDTDVVRWAMAVKQSLEDLSTASTIESVKAQRPIQQLENLSSQVHRIVAKGLDGRSERELLIASYGLRRRLDLWKAVHSAATPLVMNSVEQFRSQIDPQDMQEVTRRIRAGLGTQPNGLQWARFLMLDELQGIAQSELDMHVQDARHTAVRVLNRLHYTEIDDRQFQMIQQLPLLELNRECRKWATTNVNYAALLNTLEAFENFPSQHASRLLAETSSQLHWSLVDQHNQISRVMDSHYRNANMRIAITEDFINRMLPVMQDVRTPIRDEILGAQIFGNSATWTEVGIELIPDPDHINLQVLAAGRVDARTQAVRGPVVMHNLNQSLFHLRKNIVVGKEGVKIGRSDAVASSNSRLLGFRTEYDRFPIIGGIVRRATKQKIIDQRQMTRRILDRKVASQAESRIDEQVSQQLAAAEKRLTQKIVKPLQDLGLNPKPMAMSTTSDRIVFRGRLAGEHQLAAYTTRPRALAKSLFSVQLHESSFNNMIEQLNLGGRKGSLKELMEELAHKVKGLNLSVPEDVPDDVTLQFAQIDPIHVHFVDGHIRIVMKIKELSAGRRKWKNFIVAANYASNDKDEFQVELQRQGVVQLMGRAYRTRDQVALRGIFGVVFDKNRTMNLIHPQIAKDPRLLMLHVNQFVAREGWLGLSVSADPGRFARLRGLSGNVRR